MNVEIMKLDVIQLSFELSKPVQPAFLGPPVEIVLPVMGEIPHIVDVGAELPWLCRRGSR